MCSTTTTRSSPPSISSSASRMKSSKPNPGAHPPTTRATPTNTSRRSPRSNSSSRSARRRSILSESSITRTSTTKSSKSSNGQLYAYSLSQSNRIKELEEQNLQLIQELDLITKKLLQKNLKNSGINYEVLLEEKDQEIQILTEKIIQLTNRQNRKYPF